MNPLSPFFSAIIFIIAILSAFLIKLFFKIKNTSHRHECIDGLRGFLAIGVFIHHSAVWFPYLKTDLWEEPKSNLYNQLGQSSVSLFFMITGFLFISKLLNAKDNLFNWKAFFAGRIFRLVPLYLLMLGCMFTIIMYLSNWELKVESAVFFKSVLDWSLFTIYNMPFVNSSPYTGVITAGVVWSLPYEWLFYFSLPVISLFITRLKPGFVFVLAGLIFIITFHNMHGIVIYNIYSFIGGAIAPFLIKYTSVQKKINQVYGGIAILICLILIGQYSSPNYLTCKVLIAIMFTLIGLGISIFGILKSPALKLLGDISYSTYLLHGMILFSFFRFVLNPETAKSLAPGKYCLLICALTPVVVAISFITYTWIEKPFIDFGKRISRKK